MLSFCQWLHSQISPEFVNRSPVTLEPAAVLVGAVALLLPLRPRWKELGVAGHVEVALRVADAPAVGAVVAEQDGVGVDLLQELQVALRLDFEQCAALRAELPDLRHGVRRGELLGALPVVGIAAHEGCADRLGSAALFDDDGIELVAPVNREDLLAVLDAEQPFPPAAFEEQVTQGAGAVVRVQTRGQQEPEPAASRVGVAGALAGGVGGVGAWCSLLQKRVGGLEEELVEVEVC